MCLLFIVLVRFFGRRSQQLASNGHFAAWIKQSSLSLFIVAIGVAPEAVICQRFHTHDKISE